MSAEQSRDPQAKKGRPTPKRSEAEARRRTTVRAPKDRKEAARQARERLRAERERQRQALLNGDEAYLPPRDAGPVRRFVRDYVDSRFYLAEFFLPIAVAFMILSFIPDMTVRTTVMYVWLLAIILIVLDFFRLGVTLRGTLRNRFPDADTRGAVWYAVTRSMQMRRLRLPKAMVKRGERP
ncbi:DUF3043 domain-containing protein [Allostreptomyces psammosilenae]|uniref:Flp pilus assembly protein TadB n=1 Tax=Allostreptomyces psammosilenae TaxID=1892865 RepID=A0A853A910_9ACTN|nr:DUF3043 domain-containing protein [Allostreptomyces psammosilenae]NYI07008.1 Flp pilus assembly protein TadB [Allostreptomyces psammosilenae]